jgi:tripartite-type tricarboxylate transporter receptor subunit TctC
MQNRDWMRCASLRRAAAAAALAACATGAISAPAAKADPVADFYKGKSLTMVISSSAGGGYDALSRTIARHMGKHVPGQPNIVPRNMPGAGGIVANKFLAATAPRDGSVLGGLQNNAPLEPLFGVKEADYDPVKMNWLGTPSVETGLLFVWHTSPFRTFDDVKVREMTAGASGVNSGPAFYARVMNELLGAKIKVVAGYPGQNEAYIAIERGEIDTYGLTMWSSLTSVKKGWLAENKVRVLLQYGPEKEPALGATPYGDDLITDPEDKLLFRAAYGPLTLGRPFVLPPDVPADRVAALRKAFMAMIRDPDFRTEAGKQGLQIDSPRSGEQLQEEIRKLYATPAHLVERLRRIYTGK